ncbi:hypothetical protein WA026_010698 [Henosepilachna vigintioctopunctata]|uniref:Arrestin C-terminal-like domain-containing protein n=1 Tax=Henosepilachna vigintioctopunctata TaxID=420089 RepID=A0AAW1UNL6_9CUCU
MSIKILLNNQGPIYPGALLQGKVSCNFNSSRDVRSIKIRCYGKEHTEWRGSGKNNPRYTATHYFFQMETKLFEPENSAMLPGTYTYPFTFLLPENLPSTFEFPYGYIRYSLKGIIDIPLAVDPRDRIDLQLISVLDISTLPANLRQPCHASQESSLNCCLFFSSEPIKMEAQLNKLVFLPGETIRINLEIQNMSNDNVENVVVKLIRCFVAHSEVPRHDTRFINEDLLTKNLAGIGAHGQQIYDVDLVLPRDLPVPNMTYCQLLEGIYRLDVTGSSSGMCGKLNIVIAEIRVGHVDGPSWRSNNTSHPAQNSSQSTGYPYPSAPKNTTIYSNPLENINPTAPPPSYNDVSTGLLKNRD